MGKKFANFGFLVLVSLILTHCANRGTTSGGDKDVTPPVVIKSVPENFSVNFDATEIKIYFDEYIKMKDLQRQLIMCRHPWIPNQKSHPLGTASKFITIRISDTLLHLIRPMPLILEKVLPIITRVTYSHTINMYFPLEAISTRYRFLGSSMMLLQKEVDERIAVLLYEVDSTFTDSIIYKNKPKYIAVTDSVSGFKLENIKEGTYFLAALKEENSNYTFQSKTDKIGYRKRLITVPSDTAYVLRMFKESVDYKFNRARQVSHNKLSFGYEGDGQAMQVKLLSDAPERFYFDPH